MREGREVEGGSVFFGRLARLFRHAADVRQQRGVGGGRRGRGRRRCRRRARCASRAGLPCRGRGGRGGPVQHARLPTRRRTRRGACTRGRSPKAGVVAVQVDAKRALPILPTRWKTREAASKERYTEMRLRKRLVCHRNRSSWACGWEWSFRMATRTRSSSGSATSGTHAATAARAVQRGGESKVLRRSSRTRSEGPRSTNS